VGEVRGGDKGLDPKRRSGMDWNVRHGGSGGSGLRPGGVLDKGVSGGAEFPGRSGERVPERHGE